MIDPCAEKKIENGPNILNPTPLKFSSPFIARPESIEKIKQNVPIDHISPLSIGSMFATKEKGSAFKFLNSQKSSAKKDKIEGSPNSLKYPKTNEKEPHHLTAKNEVIIGNLIKDNYNIRTPTKNKGSTPEKSFKSESSKTPITQNSEKIELSKLDLTPPVQKQPALTHSFQSIIPNIISKIHTCNCKRTKCLKLYCECFSGGEICSIACNCLGCYNNQANIELRNAAIESILSKNPEAFNTKYKNTPNNTIYKKGCNCKKSNCLKKYCECFNAGVNCSGHCKCVECKNNNNTNEDDESNHGCRLSISPRSAKKQKLESFDPTYHLEIGKFSSPQIGTEKSSDLAQREGRHSFSAEHDAAYFGTGARKLNDRVEIFSTGEKKKNFERRLDFSMADIEKR